MAQTWLKTLTLSAIVSLPLSFSAQAQGPRGHRPPPPMQMQGGQQMMGPGSQQTGPGGQRGQGGMQCPCTCRQGQQHGQGGMGMMPPPPPPMMQQNGAGGMTPPPPPPMMRQRGQRGPMGPAQDDMRPGDGDRQRQRPMMRRRRGPGADAQEQQGDSTPGHHDPRSGFSDDAPADAAQPSAAAERPEPANGSDARKKQAFRDWVMEQYDSDRSGTLDDQERQKLLDDLQVYRDRKLQRQLDAPSDRFVQRWDANSDGRLNSRERDIAATAVREHWVARYGHRYPSQDGRDYRLASAQY